VASVSFSDPPSDRLSGVDREGDRLAEGIVLVTETGDISTDIHMQSAVKTEKDSHL